MDANAPLENVVHNGLPIEEEKKEHADMGEVEEEDVFELTDE